MPRRQKAFFVYDGRRRSVAFSRGDTLEAVLLREGYHPDAVVIMVDGNPVAESGALEDGTEYTLIRVASGG